MMETRTWTCVICHNVEFAPVCVPSQWLALANGDHPFCRYGLCPACRQDVLDAEASQVVAA